MNKTANSFHANGKLKCAGVLDASGKPVGPVREWDDTGRLIYEINPEDCTVIFVKKRPMMDNVETKLKALENRIIELEERLGIPSKLEPEKIRAKFLELMSLIDARSLQAVFNYLQEVNIAGAMLDLPEEIKTRMLSCLSKTRRKEMVEMIEILKTSCNRAVVIVDDDNVSLRYVEVGIVDYALPHKQVILKKINSLEKMGEIVLARTGEYEIYV